MSVSIKNTTLLILIVCGILFFLINAYELNSSYENIKKPDSNQSLKKTSIIKNIQNKSQIKPDNLNENFSKDKNKLDNGKIVDNNLFLSCLEEEFQNVKNEVGNDSFYNGNFNRAKAILEEITLSENLEDFLTLKAYGEL